ncbi:DUF1553 domain-containing protein [Ulvibacterium sp.]|uniref:DUF1553 domain-containing protein n=1 Tax=Ulvibacterium sp. TaxID=2665914 RepID=UPI0026382686|nr:DUF1553 domain-containing protein [Ulvibacterium sp.]
MGFLLAISACSPDIPEEVEAAYAELPETVDFNFHVKPILSDRCFACHGPDANTRKAQLRLDLEEEAFSKLGSGNRAFVAGKPGKSESIIRMLSEDPEFMMPPPESHLLLTAKEKAILLKWVEQGAKWKPHWAFVKPERPDIPQSPSSAWTYHNEIDLFIQQRLTQNGLGPSPEADKERLLRRVFIDLTGLPPTIAQIDSFLNDKSPTAYEKVVDELLRTGACAERLALDWMDLARYADSHGKHADGWRMMWPWRDWVIKAFRENMPYDQFVTWQLAGDLLPNATQDQKLATAFNRNHPITSEGGAIDEENRLGHVWDRTETVGTAFMGLTMACARCHDHKFDPISQKDYFQMTAFFDNIKELGVSGNDVNSGPMLPLVDAGTEESLKKLKTGISDKEKALLVSKKELRKQSGYAKPLPHNFMAKDLMGHYKFDMVSNKTNKEGRYSIDGNPKVTIKAKPVLAEGKKDKSFEFTGEYDEVYIDDARNFEWTDPFSTSLWINTSKREVGKTQTLVGTVGGKNSLWRGWDFFLDSLNHLNARLVSSLPHNYIHVRSKDSIRKHTWHHVAFSYDGSGKAKGLKLFIDGKEELVDIPYDRLYKSIKTIKDKEHTLYTRSIKVARNYSFSTGENGIFQGKIDDIRLYGRTLTPLEVKYIYQKDIGSLEKLKEPATDYWLNQSKKIVALEQDLKKLRNKWLSLMLPVPEVMVMEEMPQKRSTFAYDRGDYEQPTYQVTAAVPEALPDFPENYPKNRLGLAQWFFAEENPLTARVTVNRYWQMLFGKGLVNTPDDFGVQGALPSHPQLLDWLSLFFVENGWDVKKLLKTMVMSHTYRQSSFMTPELLEKDPKNDYLARSNSYRLPAEIIRDNALAASGLLIPHIGGKSVRPYQPGNLWIEKSNFSHKLLRYKESMGDSLYRRGLYTFIRRSSPHPAMLAFDAPSRDICTVKRESTNTPLQALVLLNDVQFVEASKILAQRMQKEGGNSLEEQLVYGFRLAISRFPKKTETQVLTALFQAQLERFELNPIEAQELLDVGRKKVDEFLDPISTAALTVVANTILNHDDTYMKR